MSRRGPFHANNDEVLTECDEIGHLYSGRAALPVEANILADSVHHRTTLLLYPLRDKAGRALITDQARQVELILPDVDGVPVGQNRVTWDLPIVYPDGLGTSDAFSFMALLALAAGLMTALSPCLLQQTVYYTCPEKFFPLARCRLYGGAGFQPAQTFLDNYISAP